MRTLVLSVLTAVALTGCPSKETSQPAPRGPRFPPTPVPPTAQEACKALLEAAKLERMTCVPMSKKGVANQGEHLSDGACLGQSGDDCRAYVLFYDSPQSHAAVETLEANSAVRVAQNATVAVTVRFLDTSLDASRAVMEARVSSWTK